MKRSECVWWFTILMLTVAGLCFCEIRLNNKVIHTDRRNNLLPGLISGNAKRMILKQGEDRRVQLLFELTSPKMLPELEKLLGVQAAQVVPPNSFVFFVHPDQVQSKLRFAKSTEFIKWVGEMRPSYKTSLSFKKEADKRSTGRKLVAGEELVTLDVDLITTSDEDVQFLVSVLTLLIRRGNGRIQTKIVSPSRVVVSVSQEHAHTTLDFLKKQQEVHSIERKVSRSVSNHAANVIIQSNGHVQDENSKPVWTSGYTGRGEIVAVADTGIDVDSCFFYDPEQQVAYNSINLKHRKIVGYFHNNTDTGDYADGHGTHVCGTVAGSVGDDNGLSRHNGVAKDAKLLFQDIAKGDPQYLQIPDDIYNELLLVAKQGGARIHSNSWACSNPYYCTYDCQCYDSTFNLVSNEECRRKYGEDCCRICNKYDSETREIDRFLSENDDMLVVFAAGNDGRTSKTNTVCAPSTAKNVLSIGASSTLNSNFLESVDYSDLQFFFSYYGVSSSEECCDKGYIDCCPDLLKKYYSNALQFNHQNMASFSSRGPTRDGRNKPDVVAPGFRVISAHSDGIPGSLQCGVERPAGNNSAALLAMQGTSMATPATAGSAALVRQYYKDNNLHQNPSGPLIKASLIHSAQPLTGTVLLDGAKLLQQLPQQTPNLYYGYGLISLLNVLPLNSEFQLFTFDRLSLADGQTNLHSFQTTSDEAYMKATITWYDPPASPLAAELLVNDLDLSIQLQATGSDIKTTIWGNDKDGGDRVNNVEQVYVSHVPSGYSITVAVNAHRVQRGAQKYALVITGKNIQATSNS